MKILVINGPNINMLGLREPTLYGNRTYNDLCKLINEHASKKGNRGRAFSVKPRRMYG